MNLFKECAMKGILNGKVLSIFFNKYDLFEKKIRDKNVNFRDYYPEYGNDIRNESEIVEFVANKFKRIYYEKNLPLDRDRDRGQSPSANNPQAPLKLKPNASISTATQSNNNHNNSNNHNNKQMKSFIESHNELSPERINSAESTMESKFQENSELTAKEHSDFISHSQMNDGSTAYDTHSDSDTFFFHCTCALDTKQIEKIMKDIQIKLISKNFKQVGFM